MNRIDDELLDKLGEYFVRLQIREKCAITFGQFLHFYESGTWKDWVI